MLKRILLMGGIMALLWSSDSLAAELDFREAPEKYWDFSELSQVPQFRESPFADSKCAGLRDLLITGADVDGKRAEFFAYVGYPDTPVPSGGFPGILLIHGGGGTAYPQYMKLWLNQGYAVLALDWYNQRPLSKPEKLTETNVERAPLEGGKRSLHTVNIANMVLAHSLLRSLDNVNPEKTVFVGLSWGSWYGAMVAAVDPRFQGGIEIYCGDVVKNKDSMINGRFHHAVKVPLYWVASTNDQNVTPASLQNGFNECAKLENKSLVIRLPHSHVGFTFPSCFRMAEYFLKGGVGLPKLGTAQINGKGIRTDILAKGKGITHAILCYTEDANEPVTHKRLWKSIPAQFDETSVWAELPEKVFQCFLSAYDEKSPYNDLCGSTNLVEFPIPAPVEK
ncbi:MAG: alpha/beta fold hydrolase [Lentisphaeria bacterium]